MAEYYDPDTYPSEWNYLQSGTIIDQYIVEQELAHGGFSSVYLARQLSDQTQVAIKEYLPRKLAHRTWNNVVVANSDETKKLFMRGRSLFFEEAKVLATLKHPNIVNVINFFQENSTVYMVMVYDYGVTLDKILKNRSLDMTEDFLIQVFTRLLQGVKVIHEHGLLHLDVKPANILIRPDHDPLLLDFGAIQSIEQQEKAKQSKILSHGFSPPEQYSSSKKLGIYSDIYAVAASMRACLDLKAPLAASKRLQQDALPLAVKAFKRKYPVFLLQAIDKAMSVKPEERFQSVDEFHQELLQESS